MVVAVVAEEAIAWTASPARGDVGHCEGDAEQAAVSVPQPVKGRGCATASLVHMSRFGLLCTLPEPPHALHPRLHATSRTSEPIGSSDTAAGGSLRQEEAPRGKVWAAYLEVAESR